MTVKTSLPNRVLALCAALSALAVADLRSQTAPAPAPNSRAEANEEAVQLSPFIISSDKETGWSANETLSATRTKQALKDVPVSIDAITSDFIEDLGLFTADEVANYVANVYAPPIMENDNQQDSLAFRGLNQRNNISRNYFRWYIPSDTYNVERIDFGKGSNSLIFGEVEPGGQGAIFTKRATMKNFGSVSGMYDSEGAYRAQFDFNRKIRNGLAVRINGVEREQRTFQDASQFKFKGYTGTVTWQPFPNTIIRIEGEQGEHENARGYAGVFIREQSARGKAFSSSGVYYTSDGQWIVQSKLPSIDRSSSNGPAGGSPSLLEGDFFDVTMRNSTGAIIGTKRIDGFPKHYNIRGAFDQQGRPFDSTSVYIEQRLGPVAVELAYNKQNQHQVRTDNYFGSTISLDVNGRPFTDTTLDLKNFGNDVDAFRGTAVYRWAPWKWMQQDVIGSYEYREDSAQAIRWQYYNIRNVEKGTATAVNISSDRARLRMYLDSPGFYSRGIFNMMEAENIPATDEVHIVPLRYFASGGDATSGTQWNQTYAGSLSATGRYFGGRIQSLVGVRRDVNRLFEYVGERTEGPFNEVIMPPSRKDAPAGEYVENMAMHQTNDSMSGGLTVALTKDINVYAIYSESFRFQDNFTFDRVRFGPITGQNKEIGLKGNLLDDKVVFTLGVFNIKRDNVALSWNGILDFTATDIEDLMNPNDILEGDPRYKYAQPGTGSAARNYRSDETSKGADLTVMVRPTRGLQMRFTLARTEVRGNPDLSSFRDYYDAAVKRGNESPALLAEAKNLLDTLDVKTKPAGARAVPWSASWVIDYSFSRDMWKPLQGVRVGVNGNWRDNYLLGISNGQEMVGGTTHLVNAYVMRNQKIWGHNVRIRAGVKNLIDLENSNIRKTSFTTMSDGRNVYRYSYVMPAVYDISMTVNF